MQIPDELQQFISERIRTSGQFPDTNSYIVSLIRQDYEREQERKMAALVAELREAIDADPTDYRAMDADDIIAEARAEKSHEA